MDAAAASSPACSQRSGRDSFAALAANATAKIEIKPHVNDGHMEAHGCALCVRLPLCETHTHPQAERAVLTLHTMKQSRTPGNAGAIILVRERTADGGAR